MNLPIFRCFFKAAFCRLRFLSHCRKVNNDMRFSKFKHECSGILARVGKDRFGSVKLKLHDVEASSQFA